MKYLIIINTKKKKNFVKNNLFFSQILLLIKMDSLDQGCSTFCLTRATFEEKKIVSGRK